jgi:hypothetical protein
MMHGQPNIKIYTCHTLLNYCSRIENNDKYENSETQSYQWIETVVSYLPLVCSMRAALTSMIVVPFQPFATLIVWKFEFSL